MMLRSEGAKPSFPEAASRVLRLENWEPQNCKMCCNQHPGLMTPLGKAAVSLSRSHISGLPQVLGHKRKSGKRGRAKE